MVIGQGMIDRTQLLRCSGRSDLDIIIQGPALYALGSLLSQANDSKRQMDCERFGPRIQETGAAQQTISVCCSLAAGLLHNEYTMTSTRRKPTASLQLDASGTPPLLPISKGARKPAECYKRWNSVMTAPLERYS